MTIFDNYEVWFVIGSQHLYGPETLRQVTQHAEHVVNALNTEAKLPCKLVLKPLGTTPDEITAICRDANYDDRCAGLVVWLHTFSPAKMWINGLTMLNKPLLQFHTQFNAALPWDSIDMDFMNLNQTAHGGREFGFIGARMRLPRKIIAGYWQDAPVLEELGAWMRSAIGYDFSHKLRIVRFGDNMRDVAVTEGDKVEAQIKLGWQVDYWPVGHLVETMDELTEAEVDAQMDEYRARYDFATDDIATVRYQAKEEAAMRKILAREGAQAFINNFQDLYGMEQLPGLASQNMMADGIGYGGEGDWKVSGMTAIMKKMAEGLEGGTLFMEDYTYDLEPGNEISLGAHMLEVCPSIAAEKPRIEIQPLGHELCPGRARHPRFRHHPGRLLLRRDPRHAEDDSGGDRGQLRARDGQCHNRDLP